MNISKGAVLAERVREARSSWARMAGLLGRDHLPPGHGLLIVPCSSVHTFFMCFPIDVAFLDKDGQVVRACGSVPPPSACSWAVVGRAWPWSCQREP